MRLKEKTNIAFFGKNAKTPNNSYVLCGTVVTITAKNNSIPAQHGFFRLVRSVQQGEVPLDGADKHISDSAKRMKPRDSSEFPAAKHKEFPKIKDTTEKRITSKAAAALIWQERR